MLGVGNFSEKFQRFESVHGGHFHIEEDQIGNKEGCHADGIPSAVTNLHFPCIGCCGEDSEFYQVTEILIIIHQQDAFGCHREIATSFL